ncbi:MAG: hypothetical protein K1X91_00770 [Bacteriodetes bacterium]|nr:hypothetical protein [Bacteroidota bacterium]
MGKILMIVAVVLIVGTLGKWGYDCNRYGEIVYYTKTTKITTVKEKDPLFGTTIDKSTSEPGYWLGLLDIEFPFGALPLCCVWSAIGVAGFIMQRKQK